MYGLHPFYRTQDRVFRPQRARDHFFSGTPGNEAGMCAELSRLVYIEDKAYVARKLAEQGLKLIDEHEVDGADSFLIEGDDRVYLVFRGTESRDYRDIVRDATVWPVQWRGMGRVHKGFAEGLDGLWPHLQPQLDKIKKPLVIAGHSLGGAYATLASVLAPQHRAVYSFGAPKVGCEDFATHVKHKRHFRYVGCADLVPRLMSDTIFPYRHVGQLRYIDRFGRIAANPPEAVIRKDQMAARWEYLKALRDVTRYAPAREFADHGPINYSTAALGVRRQPLREGDPPPMERRRSVITLPGVENGSAVTESRNIKVGPA
ncbi:MAG: hypothetical protein Alpg2KO_33160 [Alphaproteobacteria bacterium]